MSVAAIISAMHVTCPQCHATYELKDDIQHVLLVCHRCQTEFTTDDEKKAPPTPIDTLHPAPQRKQVRLWPWLTVVLLIIAGFGVQYNQTTWIQHPWVRNILAQFHYPLHTQSSDWLILRNQSHRQWMIRQDGSKILILTGHIQNRLNAPQRPPQLIIHFYEAPNTRPLQSITMPITMQPNLPQIRHAPYISPKIDHTPIPAHAKREFTLVFEHVPEQSREFSIEVSLK